MSRVHVSFSKASPQGNRGSLTGHTLKMSSICRIIGCPVDGWLQLEFGILNF